VLTFCVDPEIYNQIIFLVSIVLGVIALWYGHRQSEVVFIDFEAGNFNTKIIRFEN